MDLELHSFSDRLWRYTGSIIEPRVEVIIKGANWFGFETVDRVVHGLWKHNIDFYLDFLQENNFNFLRIPFSVELALGINTLMPGTENDPINFTINPELQGLKSAEILDLLITKAGERGICILLDQHTMGAGEPISELWYNDTYDEGQILMSWYKIITRYLSYENVVAVDLKNEPHGAATWGTGDLATDWRLAAERIGNYILGLNYKLLIFVEGIGNTPGDSGYWWGGNLTGIVDNPVHLSNPEKLVYSPHVYGPSVAHQSYFDDIMFPYNMLDVWESHWKFFDVTQAFVLGEWGGKGEGKDLDWHNGLADYLILRNLRSNFYWCLNPNSHDTGGLLEDDWTTPVNWKLKILARIQGEVIPPTPMPPTPAPEEPGINSKAKFLELYSKVKNSANGYFSQEGIPYHSVEGLIVEAPDHGHETTSEAYSYYIWLEALNGKITGNWEGLQTAWENMETYMIPSHNQQSTNAGYNPTKPASYAPEWERPDKYPALMEFDTPVGQDPLASQLQGDIYGMHWLLDVDNWYEFNGSGTTTPTFINTFQRGPQESVWETVPHPSQDNFTHGGPNGYLDLFVKDPQDNYSKQWRYTNAPDADARVIQAIYWAKQWADQQGGSPIVDALLSKAAKMGDWLRYSLFDKYFKPIGCQDKNAPGGGYEACHYLLSWYYAWGGPMEPQDWAFRIGCSHSHSGYQNPFTAWALSSHNAYKNKLSHQAQADWKKSLTRQMQLYAWLQAAEGGIAGGVTNSLNGRYEAYPQGTKTFHGMAYQEAPVYLDPPSNKWFGFQAWSMERVIQYYYETKDALVLPLITKWVNWAHSSCKWGATVSIPGDLEWQGEPDSSFSQDEGLPRSNRGLRVSVKTYSQDVGIMACLARAFFYYSKAMDDPKFQDAGEALLGEIFKHKDSLGYAVEEKRPDYARFNDKVTIPESWHGKTPTGDIIGEDTTFLSLRPKYRLDPLWPTVRNALDQGVAPKLKYHRFWAQAEIALACGIHHLLFVAPPEEVPEVPEEPETPVEPQEGVTLELVVANSWVSNGTEHKQYDLHIKNHLETPVKTLTIEASNMQVNQMWNLEVRIPGEVKSLGLPSWLEGNGGIKAGAKHTAGFIVTTTPVLKVVQYTV